MKKYRHHLNIFAFGAAGLFLAVFFVVISLAAIKIVKGNHFDFKSWTWKQNGMVIFSSRPSNALVYVNGKLAKFKSGSPFLPKKITDFEPGSYDLRIEKEGYVTWTKHVDVKADLVTWANYVWLISRNPRLSHPLEAQKVRNVYQSGDLSKIFVEGVSDTGNVYYIYGLNDNKKVALTFPDQIKESFTVDNAVWSTDNTHLLLNLTVAGGKKVDLVLEGRDFNEVLNLNAMFGLSFEKMAWRVDDSSELFCIRDKSLYRLNLGSKTISASLHDNVSAFKPADRDRLFVISKDKDILEVSLLQLNADGGDKKVVLAGLPQSDDYQIFSSGNLENLAVISNKTGALNLVSKIGGKVATQHMGDGVTFAEWYGDKRLLFGNGKEIRYYDLERQKEYRVAQGNITSAKWYPDGNHVMLLEDGQNYLVEFDGNNKTSIAKKAVSRLLPLFDYKTLFYVDDNGLLIKAIVD